MKIKQLTIDSKDMKQAVEAFLKTKGIDLPVHSITKEYYWKDDWEVTFEFEVKAMPVRATEPEPATEQATIPAPAPISVPQEANVF
jgi:hypothetical protein